jgi:hypothetical protein
MILHSLSRRQLLGGLLAGLSAWLSPRPLRAAAPRLPEPVDVPQSSQAVSFTYYTSRDEDRAFTSYTSDNRVQLCQVERGCTRTY